MQNQEKIEILYHEMLRKLDVYKEMLLNQDQSALTERLNSQNRSVKMILGHMVDSASNNIHRIVHLQYRESPLEFPNYASEGNNDRWIAIQNYQVKNLPELLELWKYLHLHILHVIRNINDEKWENRWISAPGKTITLEEMVMDFPRHFNLHLEEIDDLLDK